MQIALLVAHMSVNGSFHDIQNFILSEVLVHWKFISGSHVLRYHNEMLRAIIFGADFEYELPRRRLSPHPALTLVFLQQQWFWTGVGRGCGTGSCWPSLKDTNRNEYQSHNCRCSPDRLRIHG